MPEVISNAAAKSGFSQLRRQFDALKVHVDEILLGFADREHLIYESRVKKWGSVIQKLETGEWSDSDLNDYFATTLVVDNWADVDDIIEKLPERIVVLNKKDFESRDPPYDRFSYTDTNLTCKLLPQPSIDPSQGTIFDLKFEIQVKPIYLYAWGILTHDVVYKSPVFDWRRFRLSAILRALSEQADHLFSDFNLSSTLVPNRESARMKDYKTVADALTRWSESELIDDAAMPDDIVRVAQSVVSFCRSIRTEVEDACNWVGLHLQTKGFVPSISIYQLFLGVVVDLIGAKNINWESVPDDSSPVALLVTT